MSKSESVEEFLKRGGKIKVGPTPEYKSNGTSRYRMSDLKDNLPEKVPGWLKLPVSKRRRR